jgi:hypothetical protein
VITFLEENPTGGEIGRFRFVLEEIGRVHKRRYAARAACRGNAGSVTEMSQ